jgi:anaerobic magnesium-protoporphyrin IX monomethyl ester cyclase
MRIALIQPDSPYLTYPLAFPSLGLLYISAYLKANGFRPDFYDLTGGIKLPDIKADIIAFSCQITQVREVHKMREILLKSNPDARFVMGGPYPTHSQDLSGFTPIRGEGEIPMLQLCQGKVEPYTYLEPNFFPDWDAIDLSRYGYGLEGKRCINIMTKRGNCPFGCTFCAKQEGRKSPLRFRTSENVLAEVDLLRSRGFGAVAIYDDDVLLDKQRDETIFRGLKDRGMPYRCMTRTNLATEQDLQMLKDTGCAELAIGVESADEYIHNFVCKKGTTIEQDTEFVQYCKKIGLRVKTYFIFGLPSESLETICKTQKWLEENKPDNYDVSIFTPYPGSHIYSHKDEYDIQWNRDKLKEVWYSGEAQYGACAVSTSHLSTERILALQKKANYLRGKSGTTKYWGPL